jgi:ProP effector
VRFSRLYRVLSTIFPHTFTVPRRPLAIGIDEELKAIFPGIFPSAISVFLHTYTTQLDYLTHLKEGAPRFGLDGEVTGQVTEAQAIHAKQQLLKISRPAAAAVPCGAPQR